ncbi:uncharacterized protein [Clytia hemisphaerica]
MKWLTEQTDNHRYIASMVFDYLFGVMLFRISVRRNCFEGVSLAMKKLLTLFFVRDHPFYQKIATYHLNVLDAMPKEVKELYITNMAGSISGNTDSAQGGDAIMEEMNKKIKFWIPKLGVPTNESWQKTIRLFHNIEKVFTIPKTSKAT